ncbi:cell envelope integrity protein CreD [Faecalibacter bovis]|uniref:Cell envelope integrity protein CreD n=1 Tax=Faecalibacter bovis TaxID=2898187 RepID=A0ABX7XCG0_9FLAO|nr:cell envelope integrity protein CreD [Faecalibacter bovis]QTV05598.1 cell envelope integrity protein CreD [Faecalibacter bovis]
MENQFEEEIQQEVETSKSTMTKGLIILGLTLLMLIPIPFILNLIIERQESQENVIKEISTKWSGSQVVYGPFLQIKHNIVGKDEKGKQTISQEIIYVSANENWIDADVNNTIKRRNLYDVVVYNSKLNLKSSFPTFDKIVAEANIKPENIVDTKLVFAIKDEKGFNNKIIAKAGNKSYPLNFDDQIKFKSGEVVVVNNGYELEMPESNNVDLNFLSRSIDPKTFDYNSVILNIDIKGSNSLKFLPSALHTNVNLSSNWKDLKFDGYVLPSDSLITTNNKTTAQWKVYQQNPMNGQFWKNNIDFETYAFGVDFLQMNDHYDKTYRSTKYAILFIGLTFVAFFFIENRNKFNIHIVQYALVGFAICINFVLLLSISEYLGFDYAYFISAFATLGLITFFINSFLKSWKLTVRITMIILLLYLFIYSVLQLKEHALLVGSIGLFIILAIIMYYSKNIEWISKK